MKIDDDARRDDDPLSGSIPFFTSVPRLRFPARSSASTREWAGNAERK
ncbi:MAG: hypothetical protein ABF303_01095 [Desulfobacterales bacterium]